MAALREHSRRIILPLIGAILAGYYLLVFLPLSRKAAELDAPLQESWKRLAASLGQTNATALDLQHVSGQLEETREALAAMADAERRAVSRLQPGPELAAHMSAPFRLLDYQNELSRITDDLRSQAAIRKIQFDPWILGGFPQHRTEVTEPALLWAALKMAQDLTGTAVACGVTAIHELDVPANFTNSVSEPQSQWVEVPLTLEFSGDGKAAAKVLESLPLRSAELKASGLPEVSPDKSVLYIDRLMIKREAPEQPDHVRVWLKAVGFIFRP